MAACNIQYIPQHLHYNEKPLIPNFFNTEELYWRLGKHPVLLPYSEISLRDVSVNRSGENNTISVPDDVLWNIDEENDFEKHESEIVTLSVRKAFPESPEQMPVNDTPPSDRSVIMKLIHNPVDCNYAHCMFVFDIGEVRVTADNYDKTFGKNAYKRIRQSCRDILHKAIIKKEIQFPPV